MSRTSVPVPTDASGPPIAVDSIGGIDYQLVKQAFKADPNAVAIVDDSLDNRLPVRVSEAVGATGFTASQAAVTNVSGQKVGANARRRRVILRHLGDNPNTIYIGPAGVTTGTGTPLPAIEGAELVICTTAAIHAVTAAGTATLSYIEESEA